MKGRMKMKLRIAGITDDSVGDGDGDSFTLEPLGCQHHVRVDGPIIAGQKDLTLHFRGSRNQRVIDMKKTRDTGHVVLKYTD